jgi:hypothetical protein
MKKNYKKKQWRPPSNKKKRGKNLSPRNRKACPSVSTALLKSVTEIGTYSLNSFNLDSSRSIKINRISNSG